MRWNCDLERKLSNVVFLFIQSRTNFLNALTLLGLQMSGYVEGLRTTARQPEERDAEDGVDSATLESEIISSDHTSSSLFIY